MKKKTIFKWTQTYDTWPTEYIPNDLEQRAWVMALEIIERICNKK